jgi:hypothetical protein
MEAAVHIAVITFVESGNGIDHGARLVGGRGVVEIDQRMITDVLVENGEIQSEI